MIGYGFGASTESRSFHIHVGAAIMDSCLQRAPALEQHSPQFLANRIGKSDMCDNATPKKSMGQRLLRSIQKLIRENDMTRLVPRLKRAHRAYADDPGYAQFFQSPNVCAMIQLGWQNAVAASVSGKEHHVAIFQSTVKQIVRGRPKWCFDADPFLSREAFYVIQATSADDSN